MIFYKITNGDYILHENSYELEEDNIIDSYLNLLVMHPG